MSQVTTDTSAGAKGRFSALHYRDFRLIFFTGGISTIGNWMEIVLRNWLVYQISGGSPLILGLSNLVHWLPFLLLSPLAGVYVDRWGKKGVLMVAQSILTIVTMLLGVLTLMGIIQIWHILVLVLIHGISEAFDNPARQSLVSDLVAKGDVMNAISLNSAAFYGTRLIGPAAGGFLIAAAGTGIGFLINGLTFVPYIIALHFIHPLSTSNRVGKTWQDFKEGLSYVKSNPSALTILTTVGIISTFSVSYQALLPIFADDILLRGAKGLGFLSAATGLGAIIGSVFLAYNSHRIAREGRFICLMATAFGVSLLVFSFSKFFWLSLLCLVVAGASNVAFSSSGNAVLQTNTPDSLRGRVMGVFTMTSMGTNVFGSLILGELGATFGAPGGLAISSSIAITTAVMSYVLAPGLRQLRKPTAPGVPG